MSAAEPLFHSAGGTAMPYESRLKSDDWWTPPEVWDALPEFDLDPCSPEYGPAPWAKVRRSIAPPDDGLAHEWEGHVWLNPPYSKPGEWLARLAAHGDGVALIFARTETGWWQDHVWPHARSILFLRGRVSFVRPGDQEHGTGHNAPSPSALVAFGSWGDDVVRSCMLPGALAALAVGAP